MDTELAGAAREMALKMWPTVAADVDWFDANDPVSKEAFVLGFMAGVTLERAAAESEEEDE
jgi:hypothetical protein